MTIFKKRNDNERGFTLIEVIVALSIFVVMTIPLFNFLAYSLKISEQLLVKNYLLENARITLDFLTTQVRMAEELEFTVINEDGEKKVISKKDVSISPDDIFTLSEVKFKGIVENKENTAIIIHNLTKDVASSKYHRVDFGGSSDVDGEATKQLQ